MSKPVVKLKACVIDPPGRPSFATPGAAGADIRSAETITLWPGVPMAVSSGYTIEVPEGYELQVRPRSGLALKNSVTVLNAPGTIDSDYRGEMKVILMNFSENPVVVQKGDRIAQAVLAPVVRCDYQVVTEELSETSRGSGGFGSTGKS